MQTIVKRFTKLVKIIVKRILYSRTMAVKTPLYRFVLRSLAVFFLFSSPLWSQSDVRTVGGFLTLDTVIEQPLAIEVSIRNHGFIVVPPSFTVSRPILSAQSIVLNLEQGQQTISFSVPNVSTNAVDYSIRMRCLGCENTLPEQYFTTNGPRRGLGGGAYLAPEALSEQMRLFVETLGVVSGVIESTEGSFSRSSKLTVSVLDAQSGLEISSQRVALIQGAQSASFSIRALERKQSSGYLLTVACVQCTKREQSLVRVLDPLVDHNELAFSVRLRRFVGLTAIERLLLDEL